MAKLYNNLGLKMMERRKHEEALGLVRGGRGARGAPPAAAPPVAAKGRPQGSARCELPSGCRGSLVAAVRPPPLCSPAAPWHPPLQLRKAEAVVDNAALWQGAPPARRHKRDRMRAITYNNLGCLFKRRNMPGLALQVGAGGVAAGVV